MEHDSNNPSFSSNFGRSASWISSIKTPSAAYLEFMHRKMDETQCSTGNTPPLTLPPIDCRTTELKPFSSENLRQLFLLTVEVVYDKDHDALD